MLIDSQIRRTAGWLGIMVAGFALVVIAASLFGSDIADGRTPVLRLQAALALASLGLALSAHVRGRSGWSTALVSIGLGLALVTVAFVATGRREALGLSRMSPHAAICVVINGVALLCLRQPHRRTRWPLSAWFANLSIALGAAGLLAQEFPTSDAFRPLRVSTGFALALIALGAGTLLARPNDLHVRILFQRTTAGLLARRLFFGVAIMPLLLCTLLAWLLNRELLTVNDGLLLLVAALALCGFAIALFSIDAAEVIDGEREEAKQALLLLTAQLQEQAAQLQQTVDLRTRELQESNATLRGVNLRLEQLNQRFELATRATALGVWEWDAASGRSTWDARTLEIYGLTATAFNGTIEEWTARLHPADRAAALTKTESVMRSGQTYQLDFRIVRANDGAERYVQSRAIVQRDPSGKVLRITGTERDVTSEREAILQTRSLNERLKLALRSSNFGVWEYDIAQKQRLWDERMMEIYGIPAAEFDPERPQWEERLHPEDRANAIALVQRLLAGEISEYTNRFRALRPDGTVRHIEAHGYLQRDGSGRALRVVGLTRDITPQAELQQALDFAEQRWQLAIEGTNDSVWDWNVSTGEVYHDQRWARMLGYEPVELRNTDDGWKELVHPDDLRANEAAIQEHFEQRTPFYRHELRMQAKDGSWRWILVRGRVVRRAADGQPLRMAGTHSDITARKKLEERLRKSDELANAVSQLAQIGGWEIDFATSRVTWNEGARRIHEVDESFQPTLETVWQFFPPEPLAAVQAAMRGATPAQPAFDVETQLLTARGRRIWVRILGRSEFQQHRAISVHGAIQDITARHDSEVARRELETQLFQAQKMETLGTLAGGIAHDFNNLLTGIIGYHELACDSLAEDHPARFFLKEAGNAGLRARKLVEQILTFGRHSGSGEHGPIDLTSVIEEARRFLRATLPANISIEVHIAEHSGAVPADPTQIHQVLLNLGSNAGHAMRQQGGALRISLEPAEVTPDLALTLGSPPAASYVRLSVSDTGHGMDEATRRRIFDPFFTTKKTQGTGLGLAVVHGIVRSHRGAIDVESTPGRGATFHIYLPTAEAPKRKPPAESSRSPRGGGEFICVVDDEDVVASCTRLVLESRGYRTFTYASAEHCLAELEPDLAQCAVLLTDQTMPGMQGTELAAELRKRNPNLPVVIMSGYFSKISPQTLDALGRIELLAKPFTTDELALAVHRALQPPAGTLVN